MRNFWYVAATSRELARRPVARTIDGEPVVLFRDSGGRAAALRDRCSHRNVQLSLGWAEGDCVRCPYHGWKFDPTGRCVSVPALEPEAAIPRKSAVPAYPVREEQGYIWVWVGDEDPGDRQPFHLPHVDEAGWGHARLEATIRNSVGNVIENFIDCPHTGFVHRGLFRTEPDHSVQTVVRTREDGIDIEIDEASKTRSLFGRLLLAPGERVTHVDSFTMPSVVRVHYAFGARREIIGYQLCTPVAEFETRVYVHVTWRMGWLTPMLGPLVRIAGRRVIDQDLTVLENQAQVIQAHGEDFTSTQADTANLWIHNFRQRAQRPEGPPNQPGLETRVHFRL